MACSSIEHQEFEGGYELKMVNEDKDLECSICIHLLKEAMGTPCSHVFCRGCIQKLIGRENIGGTTFTCPDCQQQVDTDKVHPNTFLDRKVGGSNVYCLQRSEGCEWIGTLNSFFQKHQSECDFQMVPCIYEGCFYSGIKLKIKDHESKCQYRTVQCEHCQPGIKTNLLEVLRKDLQHMVFTSYEFTRYQSKMEAANKKMQDEIDHLKYQSQSQVQDLRNEIHQLKSANAKLQSEVQLLRRESSKQTNKDFEVSRSGCSNQSDQELIELLLNGAEEWTKRKEPLHYEETNKYQSWYKRVFMLLKENEVYKVDNAMFIKLKNKKRRDIYWPSNNEAEQGLVFDTYNECYVSKDGSMVRESEIKNLFIETKTLDHFMLRNSKALCLNRFGAGKGYTKVFMQRGSFKEGWFAGKPRMNHGWSVEELSDDFYLNDSVIVCMIRT